MTYTPQTPITGRAKARSYDGDYMAVGKTAEEIVMAYLKSRPYVLEVDDFRSLRISHEYDVDIGIKLVDGRTPLAEIKSDRHLGKTGNMLFEVLRINHTAPPERACVLGWAARSPATWLLYYASSLHHLYQCKFDDLRRAFQSYTADARGATTMRIVETDAIKTTVNVLIPQKYWSNIVEVHNLNGIVPMGRQATAATEPDF